MAIQASRGLASSGVLSLSAPPKPPSATKRKGSMPPKQAQRLPTRFRWDSLTKFLGLSLRPPPGRGFLHPSRAAEKGANTSMLSPQRPPLLCFRAAFFFGASGVQGADTPQKRGPFPERTPKGIEVPPHGKWKKEPITARTLASHCLFGNAKFVVSQWGYTVRAGYRSVFKWSVPATMQRIKKAAAPTCGRDHPLLSVWIPGNLGQSWAEERSKDCPTSSPPPGLWQEKNDPLLQMCFTQPGAALICRGFGKPTVGFSADGTETPSRTHRLNTPGRIHPGCHLC